MPASVAITGVGAVSALGVGARALIDGWAAGTVGIADGVGRAEGFDPIVAMTPKESRRADRFTQLAMVAATEALTQAGWSVDGLPIDGARVACVIGTGIGGLGTLETQFDVLREGGARSLSPVGIPMLMPNAAAAGVALRYGFHGPTYATVSACAAGADAIGTGLALVRAGVVDAAVVGGAESTLTPFAFGAFARMGALSRSGVSRPFDADRDGFVMGEGSGVLVLESEELVRRRGATPLGFVLGHASTVDGYHITAPHPEGHFAALAIERALSDADVTPDDVDYVNAHGTGTPLNDLAESLAINRALGARAAQIPVSSTKSAIGHLFGAGGAVEAVATVLALGAGIAPANLSFATRDPAIDLDLVVGEPRALPDRGRGRRIAIANSFGFGGHNAVLCLAGPTLDPHA
jgi:3-oxoacyl-[acyl-carrier-protein] synthase II